MNLLCGVMGVILTFQGALDLAFYLMIAASVFDFMDGFAARMLKAYSAMGKELDSLADLISFGLLPSLMIYRRLVEGGMTGFWTYIPVIICIFSALRLAKFNVDERQSENFIGLATPACAMICGSFAVIAHYDLNNIVGIFTESTWMIPAGSVILSYLLVSEIPMFSMKFKKDAPADLKWIRLAFITVAVVALVATMIIVQPATHAVSHAVLFIFIAYILMNLVQAVTRK